MINDSFRFTITFFPDLTGATPRRLAFAWKTWKDQLAMMQPQWAHKGAMPLISGMLFGQRPSAQGSMRHNGNLAELHGVLGDVDDAQGCDPHECVMRLRAAGVAASLWTTASHNLPKGSQPAGPRYRIFCPLRDIHDPADLAALVDRLNTIVGGILGAESWKPAQSYYFGRSLQGDWFAESIDGEFLDVLVGIAGTPAPVGMTATATAGAAQASAAAGGQGGGSVVGFAFPTAPVVPAPKTRARRNNQKSAIVARLMVLGLYIKELADGTVQMRCPFESSHTTPTKPGDCVYLPPHTFGYSQGNFKCMHSHCQNRTKMEFLTALRLPLATPANTPNKWVAQLYYLLPTGRYLFVPTLDQWSQPSVDGYIPYEHWPIDDAAEAVPPSRWLMLHRTITQEAWLPGEGPILNDMVYRDGQLKPHEGANLFNTWAPIPDPVLRNGIWDPQPWLDHARLMYPEEWRDIIRLLAFKLQNPGVKINYMLILGGASGIGKDLMLQVLALLCGPGNWFETKPAQMLKEFNTFVQALFVRINELESIDGPMRFHFEDKLKIYAAAPPHVLPMERKGVDPVLVPNVLLMIATTNHKERALAISQGDRRIFLCWSPITRAMLPQGYHEGLAQWLESGGAEAVMQYLLTLDVSDFNPNSAAPMTQAKQDVQAVSEDPLGVAVQDLLDLMGRPMVLSLDHLEHASNRHQIHFDGQSIKSQTFRNRVPGWLREAGYSRVANPGNSAGHFIVRGRRVTFYCRDDARENAVDVVKMQIELGI